MAFMSIVSILCSSLVIVGGLHQFLALHPNMHGFFILWNMIGNMYM